MRTPARTLLVRLSPMRSPGFAAVSVLLASAVGAPALAADSTCRTALEKRVQACAQACIDKAKAAVDPEIRDRILGYGCTNNCAKLEMFNGHNCPS